MVGILGANSVSGGYEIDNSLRFNDGDSSKLTFTPGGAGDRDTFTFSFWVKRGVLGTGQRIFSAGTSIGTNNNNVSSLLFESNDTLKFFGEVGGSASFTLQTNRLFRDPSAWYHIVVAVDTEDGTAANRIKLYVNGVQESSFSTATYMNQNTDTFFNAANLHNISYAGGGGFVDGYLAEFHHIDGTQVAPTEFGEVDDNGVWIPKAYTGAYGTNGFYLEFKETGTDADASGMGADTSGNDNHFAPTNLAATDVTTDTPTNNFATANPLSGFGEADLKEGNCLLDAGGDILAPSTIGFSSGKWYMEMKSTITAGTGNRKVVGIYSSDDPVNNPRASDGASDNAYPFTGVIVNLRTGVAITSGVDGNATDVGAFANNDICSLAYDGDNGLLYIYKNGSILNSGNALNAGNALDTSKTYLFYLNQDGGGSNNGELFLNFGNPSFAISSSNADANGYGNFEYAVPSGFYSLCTKNLAEFG